MAVGAFNPDPLPVETRAGTMGERTLTAWLHHSPVPLWLPITLATLLVVQLMIVAVFAMHG